MSLDGEFIAVRERERERAEAASLYSGDFYQQRHFIKITNGMGYQGKCIPHNIMPRALLLLEVALSHIRPYLNKILDACWKIKLA